MSHPRASTIRWVVNVSRDLAPLMCNLLLEPGYGSSVLANILCPITRMQAYHRLAFLIFQEELKWKQTFFPFQKDSILTLSLQVKAIAVVIPQ